MFIKLRQHTIVNSDNIIKIEKVSHWSGGKDWKFIRVTLSLTTDASEVGYEDEEQRNAEFDRLVGLLEAK